MTGYEITNYRRRSGRALAALCLILSLAWPAFTLQAQPAKKTAAARKPAAKKAAPKKTARGRATASARSRKTRPRRASSQLAPTPERYKEIQQALAGKGYTGGPVDGAWGPQWAEALKRFQRDQKIEPSGKLNSLSLLALGLGPKRDSGVTAPPTPASESPKRELP